MPPRVKNTKNVKKYIKREKSLKIKNIKRNPTPKYLKSESYKK